MTYLVVIDTNVLVSSLLSKHKDASTGRNPRTGETVKIPARVAVTVKVGSKLKDALN